MFAKFRIEKPEYSERSVVSLPLLEAYDERIRHLLAENNQLRARKIQYSKIIQSQETELIIKRSEIFQLQQELQVLREEVARTRQPVNTANTVKFNVSRHSYWEVNKSTRSVKRKKIREHIQNAVEILPAEFKPVEVSISTLYVKLRAFTSDHRHIFFYAVYGLLHNLSRSIQKLLRSM